MASNNNTKVSIRLKPNWPSKKYRRTAKPYIPPPPPETVDLYFDNNSTGLGTGTELNPFGPFSEIPWDYIDNIVSAGDYPVLHLMRGKTWLTELEIKTSGGASNRIVVQPYTGDSGTADPYVFTRSVSNQRGVFMEGQSNITIDGIYSEVKGATVNNFHVIYPASNITFQNCTGFYSDNSGFVIIGNASSIITNVEIVDCLTDGDIENRGYFLSYVDGGYMGRNETRFRCGEYCCHLNQTANMTIEENKLYEGRVRGISVVNPLSKNNIIRKNWIDDAGISTTNLSPGILLQSDGGGNEIYLNVMTRGQKFISFYNSLGGNLVYNNSYSGEASYAIYTTGAIGNNTLKNNIFNTNAATPDLVWANGGGKPGYVWENNIWWNTSGNSTPYTWSGSWNFSQWQASPRFFDTSGSWEDPLYISPTYLPLQAGSPAITGAEQSPELTTERLHPDSVWPNNVITITQPETRGAYGYIAP